MLIYALASDSELKIATLTANSLLKLDDKLS